MACVVCKAETKDVTMEPPPADFRGVWHGDRRSVLRRKV